MRVSVRRNRLTKRLEVFNRVDAGSFREERVNPVDGVAGCFCNASIRTI